jgi:hypothetical protein
MSLERHKLGVKVEAKSLAVWKWWRFKRKVKSFIEGERYVIQFKFKNLGAQRFHGGHASMYMSWPAGINVRWPLKIPPLEPNEVEYATYQGSSVILSEAVCSGLGLILCSSIASDGKQDIDLMDLDGTFQAQVGRDPSSVDSIQATTWSEFLTRYGFVISALGLFIVALEKIVSFLWWLQFLVRPDP